MPEKPYVRIYSDGSSRGNPGPGGFGTVLEYTDPRGTLHVRELSGGFSETTNNRMELLGAITGLEALTRPCRVTMVSDSQYLVHAFTQHWIDGWIRKNWMRSAKEKVKNTDLWQRLLRAMEGHEVEWEWVRGHNGHPQNERCDALAVAAGSAEDLPEDPGYEPEDA